MIKPDAVEKGHIGAILEKITASGFRIVAMKLTQMTKADAEEFYGIHKERPFFGELVEYMTRGPIVAAILEKDNAVEDFRTLIGATNPAEAAEGTIRQRSLFGQDGHGRDHHLHRLQLLPTGRALGVLVFLVLGVWPFVSFRSAGAFKSNPLRVRTPCCSTS